MDGVLLAVKLVSTPLVIAFISLLERRFGHAVAGLVFGFPLTSSLASAFLAVEQGPGFARDAATGMLAGITTLGLFVLAFAHAAARHARWPVALGIGLAGYAVGSVAFLLADPGLAATIVAALITLALGVATIPHHTGAARPSKGRWELPLRMVVGTGLVVLFTTLAATLGPRMTGLLLLVPAVTATLACFVLARAGPAAVLRLLRAVSWGAFSFVAFFAVVGLTLGTMPTGIGFLLAGLAAVGASAVTWRLGVSRLPVVPLTQ